MLRTALATLRFRWASLAGAALALVLGSGVAAMMITTLAAASVTPFPGPQRFAAAPTVVVPGTALRLRAGGATTALPVLPPGPLSPLLVRRLAATGKVVADRTFPVQQAGGPASQVGHPWQAAAFTPYRLVAGHPPATSDQVVIGGGSPRLVGHRVRVTTPAGTAVYLVSGVTAPVWFEHAIFFSSAAAARLRPGEALRDASASSRVMTATRWVPGIGLLAGGAYAGRAIITGSPGNAMILKDGMPALVLIVTGCALLAPVLLRPVARAVTGPLARAGAWPMVVRQNVLWAARRTAATAAPAVLALGLAIAMLTLEASASAAAQAAGLRMYGTDLVIVPAGPAELGTRTVSAVRAVPGAQATVLTPVQVTLAAGSGDYIATLTAQAATRATLTATQHLTAVSGSLTRLPSDFLIVDQRTATADGLRAGQPLTGYLPDRTRVPLRIAAVIRTGMTQPTVYISASHAAGQPPGQIDVTARKPKALPDVASALRAAVRGSGARLVPASQLPATLPGGSAHDQAQNRQATAVILGMALIYCIIAIANTMMIAATARKREIAALGLAGATRGQVLGLVTAESALTVLVGAIVAAAAAAVVITGQHAALTRFANAAPVVIPWQPIAEVAAACLTVAVTASALSAAPALRTRLIELTALRE